MKHSVLHGPGLVEKSAFERNIEGEEEEEELYRVPALT